MNALILSVASFVAAPQSYSIPHEKYVLESNGLEVILSEDHTLPIVAVNVWYHAGPINEAPGRTGFAHLFEHLMFQGSKHVGDDQHIKILESVGASGLNGTTNFDRTNYFETVPSNQLELALWLESDRMGFLLDALTLEKLDNQREVVKNERRQSVENVPYGPSAEAMFQTMFAKDHPYYGYVIGSMADLTAATLDDVKSFFNEYYAPANATIVIAGDFEADHAKALVTKYFASLAHRPPPAANEIKTAPVEGERRELIQEPVQLSKIQMAWLSPPAFAPGDADCDILAFAIGRGKSSRMYRRLVYDLQLAQSVQVSQESMALTSLFRVSVTARPGVDIMQVEAEIEKALDDVRKNPLSDREIERARNQLITHMISSLQQIGGFGGKADMLNRYNQYVGTPDYLATDLERYEKVTAESVSKLANSMLTKDARVVITTVPQ